MRPQSAPLQTLLGNSLLALAKPEEARIALVHAVAADPQYTPAALALAELDLNENRLESARAGLQAVTRSHPGDIDVLLLTGRVKERSGDRQAARVAYRAVLQADGSNIDALNSLAYSLVPGNPDEALAFAQQALQFAPDNPAVQDTLGWVYFSKHLYSQAVQYLESAVRKEPTAVRRLHLAQAYLKSGNKVLGYPMLQSVLAENPKLMDSETAFDGLSPR